MPRHPKDIGTEQSVAPVDAPIEETEKTPMELFKEEILNWENLHLAKIDPKIANVEFGQIAGLVREIGERCNRRLVNATQGRCGACEKPLGGRPWNQVSIFNMQLGKYEEKYSCSERCNVKLVDMQHRAAVATQAAG